MITYKLCVLEAWQRLVIFNADFLYSLGSSIGITVSSQRIVASSELAFTEGNIEDNECEKSRRISWMKWATYNFDVHSPAYLHTFAHELGIGSV